MWATVEITLNGVKKGYRFEANIEKEEHKLKLFNKIDACSEILKNEINKFIENGEG